MKIIHIVRNIEYIGGTEKFLISLLKYWRSKYSKDDLTMLCIEGIGPISEKIKQDYKIELVSLPITWWNPVGIVKLAHKLKELKPDIVHTHLFQADFAGVIASKIAKKKVVSTKYCEFSRALEKNNIFEKKFTKPVSDSILEFILSKFTDRTIVVSEKAKKHFLTKGYAEKLLDVIPCCHISLDNKLFKIPIDEVAINKRIIIGTVSRLVPEKGIDNLLCIFNEFQKNHSDSRLIIAGGGYLMKDLRKQTEKLGISRKVQFLGHIDNIEKPLVRINIFVFTSHTEGFPLAIQEAMSAGRAIISTKVGGISEMIKDKQNGLLFSDGDNKQAVDLINTLVSEPKLAQRLSENARKHIKKYRNLNEVASLIHNLYVKLER